MVTVVQGNRREVPGGMPPTLWHEKVLEYEGEPFVLPWYDPVCELLPPAALARLRAKVRVWVEVTGELPEDVDCWWEVRVGRREGYVPLPGRVVTAHYDEAGVLHCGHCKARWSLPVEIEHCTLCGSQWLITQPGGDDG